MEALTPLWCWRVGKIAVPTKYRSWSICIFVQDNSWFENYIFIISGLSRNMYVIFN